MAKKMIKLTDKNRLSILRPDILKIWNCDKNDFSPEYVTFRSVRLAWFICSLGHEWQRRIAYVKGCPFCDGKSVDEQSCLKTNRPDLMTEWDFEKNKKGPEEFAIKSNKRVWWRCKSGHNWEDTVSHRYDGRGCPFCSNHRVHDKNSLFFVNPKLSKQWHPIKNGTLTPKDVMNFSNKKVWWMCEKGHEWAESIANRQTRNCPFCGKVLLKNGALCASMTEAYYYLKLIGRKMEFCHNQKYGFKRKKYRFDFYVPKFETYIEVTGYNKKSLMKNEMGSKLWREYIKKINKKKNFVEKILHKKFRFIQMKLNSRQLLWVRKNMA